jgi:hypothetical protein
MVLGRLGLPSEIHDSEERSGFHRGGSKDRTGARPACPVAPEDGTGVAPEDGTGARPACPVAPEDGTGVAPEDGTGV